MPATDATGRAGAHAAERPPRRVLVALCVTEVISWGTLYYALPVALGSITSDTGWSATAVTAAFSGGLVVSAAAGIPVGRWLDRYGPRPVMTGGSILAVPAMVGIALAPSFGWFLLAWLVAGLAMAAVFYQAAFAALTRWYGPARISALTRLTLIAGLASTIFAPATHLLLEHLSWRGTYLALAVVLASVTIPLHALALSPPWVPAHPEPAAAMTVVPPGDAAKGPMRSVVRSPGFLLLSAALTVTSFGMYCASLTLIPLLTGRGMSASLAATTLGLLLGRLAYAPLSRRTTPTKRAVAVVAASAAAIAALAVMQGPVALLVVVSILAGAVRGAGTLLQATVVADRWGSARYGALSGWFAAPITTAAAVAPWAGTAMAEALGSYPAMFGVLAALVLASVGLAANSGRR